MTGPVRVLTEGEFLEALRLEFADEIDPERFTLDAKVGRDLELDSLQLLRLYAFIESFAPITLPEQLDPWEASLADRGSGSPSPNPASTQAEARSGTPS